MEIRKLTKIDYPIYKTIRLELLKNHPENFGSSFEEESKFDDQQWINRITKDTLTEKNIVLLNFLVYTLLRLIQV